MGSAAAEIDAAGQQVARGQLLEHQLHAGRPDRHVVGDDTRHVGAVGHRHAAGVVHLDFLGPRKRQVQAVRDRFRERAATEGEHARALDAAVPDARHVRGAAADVDEESARLQDLIARHDAGHGVRLGNDLDQLQIQLLGHALQRAEMNERREGVEDADLDVAARNPTGLVTG